MANQTKTFLVEDARIIFRNFAGREGQYNAEGDRNFAVILDQDAADEMIADGWNVKYLKPYEEDEDPVETPYISVAIKFNVRPPRIVMMTSRARTHLDENTVEVLDWADFANVDIIGRAYEWNVNGKSGIKAYLQSMFVTIEEDYLEMKYAVDPVDPQNAIGAGDDIIDAEHWDADTPKELNA